MSVRQPAPHPTPSVEGRIVPRGDEAFVPRRVAQVATQQRGVISWRQLQDLGIARGEIDSWRQRGRLHPLHVGVYAVGHRALPPGAHFLAAVLAAGPGAALSHASAAAHLGLRPSRARLVDVMVPRSGERARDGIRFHRPKIFGPEDVRVFDSIPTTTVARTLVDLAGVVRFEPLELAVEQAERLRMLDVKAIADVLARISRPRGVRNLRRCLGPERLDATLTKSRLERRFLQLCRIAGLPRPLVNQRVEVSPGLWPEVDFLWPAERLVVETDSWRYHGTPTEARRDRRRDRQLRAAGYRVERFMWDDVLEDPTGVAAALRPLLQPSRDE
ncbi:MAG TPA: type IV toxin-antitoxin system AbiEi family antitoxin domain-containing protein [Baekduia sp.]|nr:type IV toxin-antitoxin system AbiEi family antitoxin domain-containing protein [Baekduia sp.]